MTVLHVQLTYEAVRKSLPRWPSMGKVWIFSGTTQSFLAIFEHVTVQDLGRPVPFATAYMVG